MMRQHQHHDGQNSDAKQNKVNRTRDGDVSLGDWNRRKKAAVTIVRQQMDEGTTTE